MSDCSGMGGQLSNLISSYLEPITDSIPHRIDIFTTEDAISRVEKFNLEMEGSQEQFVLIGADACALYPSIQAGTSAKAVGDEVREHNDISFECMDWEHVSKYVATNVKPWEAVRMKVNYLLPKRVSKGGRRPTVTGKTLTKPSYSTQKVKEIWQPTKDTFTAEEQKL